MGVFFNLFNTYFYIGQIAVYLFACNRILRRHETEFKQSRSNPEIGVQIEWLRHVFTVFGFYAGYEFFAGIYLAYNFNAFAEVVFLSLSILSIFIFLIAYNSIRQPEKLFAAMTAQIQASALTQADNFAEPMALTTASTNGSTKIK